MILCSVLSDLSYPSSLSVKTLKYNPVLCPKDNSSIYQCPTGFLFHVLFFYHKHSLSTCSLCPVLSTFMQSVCVHLSFLQGCIPRLVYIFLIPTGSPARTPLSSCVFSFCASNHLSLVSLHSCSKYCYEMLALPLFFLSAASFSFVQ